MDRYQVKIVLTEGEPIDTVIEGVSEESIESYLRSTSDFRQRNGDPYPISFNISKIDDMKMTEERTDLRRLTRQMLRMRKWTMQDLAVQLGTTRQVVSNWLNGSKGLGYERVERLLWLIGVRY